VGCTSRWILLVSHLFIIDICALFNRLSHSFSLSLTDFDNHPSWFHHFPLTLHYLLCLQLWRPFILYQLYCRLLCSKNCVSLANCYLEGVALLATSRDTIVSTWAFRWGWNRLYLQNVPVKPSPIPLRISAKSFLNTTYPIFSKSNWNNMIMFLKAIILITHRCIHKAHMIWDGNNHSKVTMWQMFIIYQYMHK
jgi:hypothetical protein